MNALECTYTHQNTHRDTQHDAHTLTKLCLNSKQTDINKNNSSSFQRCETLLVYVQNSKSDYPHEFFSLVKMQWWSQPRTLRFVMHVDMQYENPRHTKAQKTLSRCFLTKNLLKDTHDLLKRVMRSSIPFSNLQNAQ